MRVCIWSWLNLILFLGFAVPVSAQDALLPAVPTATPSAASTTPTATSVPSSTSSAAASRSTTNSSARKLQPQSVTIALIDGITLSGELSEVDQWSMKTSFGTTNLPLSTVAGLKMAQEGNAITTVVLHNGDTLTGAVQLDQVVIQTEWGRAEIHGNHVASILFTPGLKWTSEAGLNGVRWKLIAEQTPPVAPPGQPGARPGTVATQPPAVARPQGFRQ